MLSSPLGEDLPLEIRTRGWLGFPPASNRDITVAEERLGIILPPSFREFLKTSNGFCRPTHSIERVRGIQDIDWFRAQNRDWIKAFTKPSIYGPAPEICDEDYFAYGQYVEAFRSAHLKEALQVSEVRDAAVYLLNPQVINHDGEWEAWFFANWVPGARRYRSFQEMMEAEYAQFARSEWQQPQGLQWALPNEYIGSPGSPKRRIKQRKKPREKKILGKRLSQWSVDDLLAMLSRDDYGPIHPEVMEGLGLLGDRRAVGPLLAKVRDGDVHAMYALKGLDSEALREPLLEILRHRNWLRFHAAAMLLSKLKESRAIPLLVETVKDLRATEAHLCECTAQHLAAFDTAGVDALINLLNDANPQIRRRAAGAMVYTKDGRATQILRPMLSDPDSDVRQAVELVLKVLPGIPQRGR